MTNEEKISALSGLMEQGVLNNEEWNRVVAALDPFMTDATLEQADAQQQYEAYMTKVVSPTFRNTDHLQFPPLDVSMIRQGTLMLDMKGQPVRYIKTYMESTNSHGKLFHEPIIIGIDDDFTPLFWAQQLHSTPPFFESDGWVTISGKYHK